MLGDRGNETDIEAPVATLQIACRASAQREGLLDQVKLVLQAVCYRLQVETADPAGPVTSYEFDAGWYGHEYDDKAA